MTIPDRVLTALAKHLAAKTGRDETEVLKELQALPDETAYEAVRPRLYGVTRLPEAVRRFSFEEVLKHLPQGFTLESDSVHVTFTVDIDEAGNVTDAAAPPPLDLRITGRVMLSRGDEVQIVPESGKVPPVLQAAVVAAARTMRFRPAERDGRPVALRGLTLGARYSREDFGRHGYSARGRDDPNPHRQP